MPCSSLLKLPALQGKDFYDRLFSPLVTLWYLLFQRLNADHTLDAAVADARNGGADRLNKKLSQGLVSDSTCSYSDARQRLPWHFLAQALCLQGAKIIALSPTVLWHGRVIALLDGSTVRLRPHGTIPKEFGTSANQHGKPYWCLMRLVVCFCALSGAALDCARGSIPLSEQVLACQIILRSTAKCLFIGDRNFGVFRVVQAAREASQERLLVLKLQRPGFRSQQLCLFTTLPNSAQFRLEELARLYGLRWHIELNLRYLKAQMDLVQLEAKSPDMACKEWLAGLLAYNLIRAAQLCAAVQNGLSPLTLSFSSVRRRLEDWLRQFSRNPRQALGQWAKTLQSMGRCRLPVRRKSRPNEPRAQRHLRLPYAPLIGSRAQARRKLEKYASKS